MAVKWFYGADEARLGPFSAQELKELKARGRLLSTDMVWKEGVLNGLPAGEIRGLFGKNEAAVLIANLIDLPVLPAQIEAPVLELTSALSPAVEVEAPVANPDLLESGLVPIDDDASQRVAAAITPAPSPAVEVEAPVANSDPLESGLVPIDDDFPPQVVVANTPALEIPRPPIDALELSPLDKINVPGPNAKLDPTAAPDRPRAKAAPVRAKRAVADSGAIILSQDGERVRFRKKCVRCAYEDTNNSVMRLMPGMNRQLFFCPKCRKQVGVAIRAV